MKYNSPRVKEMLNIAQKNISISKLKSEGNITIERNNMLDITFRYADAMSNYEWRTQHCSVSSIEECIRIYGLGGDCDYEFIEVYCPAECEYNNRLLTGKQFNCARCKQFDWCKEIHK